MAKFTRVVFTEHGPRVVPIPQPPAESISTEPSTTFPAWYTDLLLFMVTADMDGKARCEVQRIARSAADWLDGTDKTIRDLSITVGNLTDNIEDLRDELRTFNVNLYD